jgi:choline dehydrogenase-like flavoprotein
MGEQDRVIVVGSGPPGAVAARFLAEGGADVLLLEAGSERSSLGLTLRVRGVTIAKYRRPLRRREAVAASGDPKAELFEELAPGGLTNQWSCAVPRFAPEDFADAERAGEEFGWPLGYEDVEPWYDRVEPLLHVAGTGRDHAQLPAGRTCHTWRLAADWEALMNEAWRAGRTLAPMPYAYGAATTLTPSGTPFNAFVRLVKPALRSGGIRARFGARVTRLEWSAQKRRVTAVFVRGSRGGARCNEERIPCRAVVLAAGAIGTPDILLSSDSADFPQGLGNEHDVLGRYLHDHPVGKLIIDLARPLTFRPPSYWTRPRLEQSPPLYAAACMQWSGGEMLLRSLVARTPGKLRWLGFSVFGTMAPTRDNWVRVERAARLASGANRLELHASHPPEAGDALEKAKDDVLGAFFRAGLDPRVRVWYVEPVGGANHYGGTCRMHASPRFGMLDRWSRLHAVPNVAVADSSAFTTGPEKNPVLTAMALAARAGHRLAEEMRSGDV